MENDSLGVPIDGVEAVVRQLAKLQSNTTLSDFTILCAGREWNVHRFVLALHSPVLARACEGSFKEAAERKINLSDDHPASVAALIHYFYNLDYDERGLWTHNDLSALDLHVHVCIVADKYDIQPLKALAITKFKAALEGSSSAPEVAQATLQAYGASQATRPICDAVVQYAVNHKLLLPEAGAVSAFSSAMRLCADLTSDVAVAVQHLVSEPSERIPVRALEQRWACPQPECDHTFIGYIPAYAGGDWNFACYGCERSCSASEWRLYNDR